LFNGPLEGEQERAIVHAMAQAASAFFPGLKGLDRAAELVGALVEGHMLAVAVEVILVANYWHTKRTMVGCGDNVPVTYPYDCPQQPGPDSVL